MAPLPDRSLPHLKVREALLHQLLEVSGLHIIRWAVFIASAIGGE